MLRKKRHVRSAALLAAALAITLAAGCAAAPAQQSATVSPPTPATSGAAARAPDEAVLGTITEGDLTAFLSSSPVQPLRGTAEMDAYLVGTDGKPVTNAKVSFDTDMTNMSHGPYVVETEPAGDGHYTGSVHFSMPGPWRVIAVIERPGHDTAKMRFEFTVKSK